MTRFTTGDILDAQAEALVNTVNCVGVMGRGIALQFKQRFPDNFKEYRAACARDEVVPGRMFVHETGTIELPRFIINFPTKRHWRGKSRIEDIAAGLDDLVDVVSSLQVRSVAIPPLGTGLGGLNWSEVKPLIVRAMERLSDVEVVIYEPSDVQPKPRTSHAKVTPGRAALVGLMDRYLAALMDTGVSLLEIHKLMYFLQVAGEPLRLRYVKAPYGPYAENLRHVLIEIEGDLVAGYQNDGDRPDQTLALLPDAAARAQEVLADDRMSETRTRFERVGSLVEGYETPYGLELLATVHCAATELASVDPSAVITATYDWGPRKSRFRADQIEDALARLDSGGWLEGEPALVGSTGAS